MPRKKGHERIKEKKDQKNIQDAGQSSDKGAERPSSSNRGGRIYDHATLPFQRHADTAPGDSGESDTMWDSRPNPSDGGGDDLPNIGTVWEAFTSANKAIEADMIFSEKELKRFYKRHLDNSKQAISEAVNFAYKPEEPTSILVLGLGGGRDMDFKEIMRKYSYIKVVDMDEEIEGVVEKLKSKVPENERGVVEFVPQDLTGVLDEYFENMKQTAFYSDSGDAFIASADNIAREIAGKASESLPNLGGNFRCVIDQLVLSYTLSVPNLKLAELVDAKFGAGFFEQYTQNSPDHQAMVNRIHKAHFELLIAAASAAGDGESGIIYHADTTSIESEQGEIARTSNPGTMEKALSQFDTIKSYDWSYRKGKGKGQYDTVNVQAYLLQLKTMKDTLHRGLDTLFGRLGLGAPGSSGNAGPYRVQFSPALTNPLAPFTRRINSADPSTLNPGTSDLTYNPSQGSAGEQASSSSYRYTEEDLGKDTYNPYNAYNPYE